MTMASLDRVDLVVRGIRASLTGDSSIVQDLFSPHVRAALPALASSAAALAVEIEDRRDAFADVAVSVVQTEDVGASTWVEWAASVRHVGRLMIDNLTVEPTGRRAAVYGVTVAEFEGDRIVSYHQYWDCSDLV
jgi:hypothetical protein